MMNLQTGEYTVQFRDGGIWIEKNGKTLYFNRRPVWVSVKTYGAVNVFRDQPYDSVTEKADGAVCLGCFETENRSVLRFRDEWTLLEGRLKIDRRVNVEKAREDDLGFQTRIFFYQAGPDSLAEYEYFAPGQWYLDNRYAAPYAMGKDPDLQYYWRKETHFALPMFAMRSRTTGETICLSRWAADATLPSLDRMTRENYAYVDPKITVGSFGVSRAKPEALTYTYYGHCIATPLPKAQCDGLAIDYVYPAMNGQQPAGNRGPWNVEKPLSNITWVHPMRTGFSQHYALAVTFSCWPDFASMMKATWRDVYPRLKDRLFDVDNGALYENMMQLLKTVTRRFGDVWGTPFVAQLPDFDPDSFSAEIGFVGQQAGIGYQLLRWGRLRNDAEAIEKGLGILDYWTRETMTETGCPLGWVHLATHTVEPQPQWVRQIGDGLEAILDAWQLEKKYGNSHDTWIDYCLRTGDWLVKSQNPDGSWYRSYYRDGSCCMDSKASTPCPVRFLVQLYGETGRQEYLDAAVRAGEWTWIHLYKDFEYRGGTCDQSDVMDKESGIYAIFAFIALYEQTRSAKWLEGACGAADYVETFTYVWSFPVVVPFPCHPFNRNHISGTSGVTVGSGGGDVYMAACAWSYYRLYQLSGDEHYRDFAEFIHRNTKQANDIDGSCGYKYIGLVNEGGSITEQQYFGNYHWLPWCTFVEVDPASRFYDAFGVYDVADIPD